MLITFEALTKYHLAIMLTWLNAAQVQEFWDTGTLWTEQLVEEKYGSYVDRYKLVDGKKLPIEAYIFYLDEIPCGYIQLYDAFLFPRDGYDLKTILNTPNLAAIDIFIGEKNAMGNGSRVMKQFLEEHVFTNYDACFVDPDKTNPRAIRAYEKAGFVKVIDDEQVIMIARRKI